jgi:uncharacterized protein YnzC (UPF0291/DUF896 family)
MEMMVLVAKRESMVGREQDEPKERKALRKEYLKD